MHVCVSVLVVCVCVYVLRVLSAGWLKAVDITPSHSQAGESAICIKCVSQRISSSITASSVAQPIPASHQSEFSHQDPLPHATTPLRFLCAPTGVHAKRPGGGEKTNTRSAQLQRLGGIKTGFPAR